MKEDEALAPIVAIRAINFISTKVLGMKKIETIRYEVQFRRQNSDIWELVQSHDVDEPAS